MNKSFQIIFLVFSINPIFGQDVTDINNFEWLVELTDSLKHKTDLCSNCDNPPLIRSYLTPLGIPRFVLFFQCDNVTSTTMHFEINGNLAGECIIDSMSRACADIPVLESFTLANSIVTVWNCVTGFDCDNADNSILFPEYKIEFRRDLCDSDLVRLSTSEPFETYLWSGPNDHEGTMSSFIISDAGRYEVIVSSEQGCFDTSYLDFQQDMIAEIPIEGRFSICENSFPELSLSGFDTYKWSTGDTTSSTQVTEAGEVNVTVTNEDGCMDIFTMDIVDSRSQSLTISGLSRNLHIGETHLFFLDFDGLTIDDVHDITWIYGTEVIMSPDISIMMDSSFLLTVSAVGPTGCPLEDEILIEPKEANKQLYIPNAIYPNSTSGNSHFYVQSISSATIIKDFCVFDRWGNEIYTSSSMVVNDRLSGWDGKRSGRVMPSGIYIYTIHVEYSDSTNEILRGSIFIAN